MLLRSISSNLFKLTTFLRLEQAYTIRNQASVISIHIHVRWKEHRLRCYNVMNLHMMNL